jgi:DNA-binding beta-propeller fold protein YncE
MKLVRTLVALVALVSFWNRVDGLALGADPMEFQPQTDFLQLPEGWSLGPCSAVAVSRKGEIYLFHRGKHPLICFNLDGKFLRSWGDDLIKTAHGLRIDRHDHVWVTDVGSHRVYQFDSAGKLLLALGTGKPGTDDDQFDRPTDIAFGANDDVFVSDGYGNSRVLKFTSQGKLIKIWGEKGSGPGQFHLPHAIIVDAKGRVLVGDRENKRIQVFDQDGNHLETWPGFAPYGVDISPEGIVHVATGIENDLVRLDRSGKVDRRWGKKGTAAGEFDLPHMLAFDAAGNLFIAEVGGQRLQRFVKK